jgi:hypothetical protein
MPQHHRTTGLYVSVAKQHPAAHLSFCQACCIFWKRATRSVLRTPGAMAVLRPLPQLSCWQYRDKELPPLLPLLLTPP